MHLSFQWIRAVSSRPRAECVPCVWAGNYSPILTAVRTLVAPDACVDGGFSNTPGFGGKPDPTDSSKSSEEESFPGKFALWQSGIMSTTSNSSLLKKCLWRFLESYRHDALAGLPC